VVVAQIKPAAAGAFSLSFHGRPGLNYRDDNLAVYDGLTSLTSRGVTPEATDRRPLSSKILATDVYPVRYLFIPTRAPTIPLPLSRRPRRRCRRDDDGNVSQRRTRAAPGNFRAAFPVIGKRRAGERLALIMRLESAGSGRCCAARRARPESDSQSFIILRNEKRPGAFRGQIFDTAATKRYRSMARYLYFEGF